MNVTVYCSSRAEVADEYKETARIAGDVIGAAGATLVYGGVDAGMMHITAEAAAAHHTPIVGVVPSIFRSRADRLLTELVTASQLSDRKQEMLYRADLFVVLPGGLGTIDEWMTTLSELEINGDHRRKIIVANINGVFDHIIAQLRAISDSPFSRGNFFGLNIIANSAEEFRSILSAYVNSK